MSKTLENLLSKAQKNGKAVLNGRMSYGWGGTQGPIEEKYRIEVEGNSVKLYHWGTKTLDIDTRKNKVSYVYGESNSDRDSINFMLYRFGIQNHTHFYPSKNRFELHDNATDEVVEFREVYI